MRRLAVLVVVLLGALGSVPTAAGAAVGAATLGHQATQRTVEALVHTTYPDLAFGNIACPDAIPRRRGVKFTCTVQLPGTFLVVDAVQTDGRGTVSITSPQVLLQKGALEAFVAANASIHATVDCGPLPWHAVRPGGTVTCAAALADGTTRTVTVLARDASGTVTITSVT